MGEGGGVGPGALGGPGRALGRGSGGSGGGRGVAGPLIPIGPIDPYWFHFVHFVHGLPMDPHLYGSAGSILYPYFRRVVTEIDRPDESVRFGKCSHCASCLSFW